MSTRNIALFLTTILLLFWITGCASSYKATKERGEMLLSNAFKSLEEDPDLAKVIKLDKVRIYIVGDSSKFGYPLYREKSLKIQGYAKRKNEIWLLGRRDESNRIILNQWVLGHELQHLLNFQDREVANPDNLRNR